MGRRGGLGRDPVEGVLGWVRDLAAAAARTAALEERRLEPRAGDAHRRIPAVPAGRRVAHRRPPRRRPGAAPEHVAEGIGEAAISSEVVTSVAHTSRPSARDGSSGTGVGEDEAGQDPAVEQPAMDGPGVGDPDRELVEVRPRMEPRRPDRRERRLELGRPRRPERRHVAQPVRTDGREVDRGGQRQEGLVRADVAGGLVAPDVLLAGAHRHHECALAVEVGRHPDEPAGDLADEGVGRGEDPQVRAAVLRRDPERLALARGDVGAVRAGRREDGQADRLDDGDEQRARGMGQARRSSGIGSSRPRKSGWAAMTPATGRSGSASIRSRAARSVVPAGVAVGDERDLVELETAAEVRPQASRDSAGGRRG